MAQNDANWCATPDDNTPDPAGVFSYAEDMATAQSFDPVVLNVYYWQVNAYHFENQDPLTLQKVLASVAQLNIIYNDFNIFFKYRGYDVIESPNDIQQVIFDGSCQFQTDENGNDILDPDGYGSLNRCQIGQFFNYASNNGFEKEDAINIYVPYATENFAGAASSIGTNMIVMPTVNIEGGILHHEMGHALGLSHTHSSYFSSFCEHVTRNPGDANYNAEVRGDSVTDTAAVPDFIEEYCYFNDPDASCSFGSEYNRYYVDQENCTYTGANVDCEGTSYQIPPEDVRNYMSYSYRSCFDTFSPGQAIRMQERIMSDNDLILAQTTIASLYEPFRGEYYDVGPSGSLLEIPLLQPGFDYAFHPCSGHYNQPSDYDDISFDYIPLASTVSKYTTDYLSIVHQNHTSIAILHPAIDSQPRRCYSNTNRTPIGGRVVRFEDGVINYNVTITPQDSLGINQENLINTLNPGLYKIEKDFENGDVEQTVIQKNND